MDTDRGARAEILARLAGGGLPVTVPRDYRRAGDTDPARLAALLADRLADYRAGVQMCRLDAVGATVARLLAGAASLAVPADVPPEWLAGYAGDVRRDTAAEPLTVAHLDAAAAVLTGCAVAIAETGTLVLDAGAAQGRRALSLVPDHHLCIVHIGQIVATVPEALRRLTDPRRPLTFISGPSATSDIELDRVEGVHGPRRLDVVLCAPDHPVR